MDVEYVEDISYNITVFKYTIELEKSLINIIYVDKITYL